LIAGNGEAPDVTANDATLLLFREKESLDWFAIGDLTAEEVSRLGIIDSIIAGEEKQKKSAKMDLMEFGGDRWMI
jgi:uroporphyrinogen-III synthase